jgi:putative pyruvate formate lyase activating enzyme
MSSDLLRSDELERRAEAALAHLAESDLCPRYCRVDRRRSAKGALCHTGARAVVQSFGRHHGEEDPLPGTRGSRTIFFSWCHLRCVYCQ